MHTLNPTHHVLIRANRNWVQVDWRSLWHYRDLLWLLVRRDFIAKYRQTILGPAWAVVQPVLTTLVFTVIFGRVAKLPTEGAPPVLFYLCGLVGWSYFAQTFTATSTTLVQNARLYGKVYFPRLIVPLSALFSNLMGYVIQLVTFLGFYVYFKSGAHASSFGVRWEAVFLPLLLLQVGVLSLGTGLWMSSLTAKYRDLSQMSAFIVQLWMYATPIIYPLSMLPPHLKWIASLNPMTAPVEAYRYIFLGAGSMNPSLWALSAAITLLIFVTGLMTFQRVERTFVDTV